MNPAAIPNPCQRTSTYAPVTFAANLLTIPPSRTASRRVIARIKMSPAILRRIDSCSLCFSIINAAPVTKARRKQITPNAGSAEGRNRLAAKIASRSKVESRREYFWRKRIVKFLIYVSPSCQLKKLFCFCVVQKQALLVFILNASVDMRGEKDETVLIKPSVNFDCRDARIRRQDA